MQGLNSHFSAFSDKVPTVICSEGNIIFLIGVKYAFLSVAYTLSKHKIKANGLMYG